jgi:hypothetical protein
MAYSSYYIKGLYEIYGKKNVSFSMKYFKSLKMKTTKSYDHYFAFVIKKENLDKIVIDFWDKDLINDEAYKWSDVYAKINFNKQNTKAEYLSKIIPIPPSFGIKIWNRKQSIFYAISNIIKANFAIPVSLRKFIGSYRITYNRPTIEDYTQESKSNFNYIFFISSLWTHKNCIEKTNKLRYLFIRKAKSIESIYFEGGLLATEDNVEYEKYKDVVFQKRYSMKDYINKTKQSLCVFNTPAVHNCHGWKLGEYLAMGKAIISTDLVNHLAVAFQQGKNIHFANEEKDIEEALLLMHRNSNYRKQLENGAKEYYYQNASPIAVINTITKILL